MARYKTEVARELQDRDADVRVLRRVEVPTGLTRRGADAVAGIGVVIDVETTSTDFDTDVVIEPAARRFAHDERHVITRIDRLYPWQEDPKRRLSEKVVRITGLVDDELMGKRIDEAEASRIVGSADVRIAHNAAFDRPFVERRLPGTADMPWACSIQDIGWTELGFECAKLGWILTQCRFFHEAHRAAADVHATIQIVQHEIVPEMTALNLLMTRAAANGWIVRAFGAAFDVKEVVRACRYRWNAVQEVWWKEVRDRVAEEAWLAENVYSYRAYPKARSADFEPIDWRTRHGR
ncbi:3'-5' exonuclease [Sphingomonas sp. PB2P12]|uniref:3'-5' exonuclease n=1 Tax=Sphingomonas sandaracina TaxID=3096157 RepID=UPI002FCC8108